MTDSIDHAAEQFRLLSLKWAEADGEALRAEKMEKVIFSELVNHSDASSIAKSEHWARAHGRYREAIAETVEKRTAANLARAEVDAMEWRIRVWQSRNSSRRAEMQLGHV